MSAPTSARSEHLLRDGEWAIRDLQHAPLGAAEGRLMGDYSRLRTRYVQDVMRWLDFGAGGRDVDRYDHPDAHTHYLIEERNINGAMRAYVGLRFTPVPDLDDALSLQMWDRPRRLADSPIAQQFNGGEGAELLHWLAEEVKQPSGRRLYDITRLVPLLLVEGPPSGDIRQEARMTHEAIVRLIGAIGGVAGLDSMVLFTSTPTFLRALTRMGFPYQVIARGQISTDKTEEESFLCWGHLVNGWYHVKETKPSEAKLFEEGYRAIRGEGPDETLTREKG